MVISRKLKTWCTAEAAFLAGGIGPGMAWAANVNRGRHFPLPFPSLVAPPDLVMAHVSADPAMRATLAGADIALLDLSEQRRRDIVPEGLYVVSRSGETCCGTSARGPVLTT